MNTELQIYDTENPVFQVDSPIVRNAYETLDNYLVITEPDKTEKICAIYFSGHSIYFPNDEKTFKKEILIKNRFEWYGQRVEKASKHIFIRDIHKQWYLSGINSTINSPEKLLEFLKTETKGYKTVCIGSSAGGYAAILYGIQLRAITTFAFSPRIEMKSLDERSNKLKAPLYFRLKKTYREKYMDLIPFIQKSEVPLICFYPNKSTLDLIQLQHINKSKSDLSNLHLIIFNTSKHGVCFPKVALDGFIKTLNFNKEKYEYKQNNPIIFSIRQVGIFKTICGIYKQLKKHYQKV